MKTLTSKLKSGLRTGALLTSLAFASGCAGLGAVYMQSDDPATRAWGTLMHNEGSHEQRMEEQREGKPETNVNVGGSGSRNIPIREKTYSFELINLDTGKREIEVVGFENFINYSHDRIKEKKFPTNGYLMFEKEGGINLGSMIIKSREEKEEYLITGENGQPFIIFPK